ncbi:MAG TPA: protein kinase, partial [Thermoanaerobaculia bacterium]|nr:protein kinase [Thermoanaerobaculia bacterium]
MNSPTLTTAGTQVGVILGTAAYMSPEQAKGQTVDKRADVWAFGVVVHEMLTGRRLFSGDSIPETLAGVLKTDIDFSSLPPTTPATTRRLLERCLERDPKRRLRDIGEARIALSAAPGDGQATTVVPPAPSRTRERVAFALAAVLCAALGGAIVRSRNPAPPASPLRLHLPPPEGGEFTDSDPVVLSPNGDSIAFVMRTPEGERSLAIRSLDAFDLRTLPGTSGAYEPFWSPDGRSIGFFDTHLETVDAGGLQPPRKLAPLKDGRGASWGRAGVIVYAPDPAGPLYRVDAAGGEPRPATTLDPARRETAHLRPCFLPDGKRFLYFVRSDQAGVTGIHAGSLDGSLKKQVLALDVAAVFAPPGFLLYVRDRKLVAHAFDVDRLEVAGEPAILATGLDYLAQYELPPLTASEGGRLVCRSSSEAQLRQLVRFDRKGRRLGTVGEPGDFNIDLSPDGNRLAVGRFDPVKGRPFLWIYDLARDVKSRFGPDTPAAGPVWSPDGKQIAYLSMAGPVPSVAVRPASGGSEKVLWSDVSIGEPVDWSPDGKSLLVETASAAERTNLVLLRADGSGEVVPFARSAYEETSGRFSPDGRFVAYTSNESG